MGCVCDRGYEGYDCSFRSCPWGRDPTSVETHQEEKFVMRCQADSGYFSVTMLGTRLIVFSFLEPCVTSMCRRSDNSSHTLQCHSCSFTVSLGTSVLRGRSASGHGRACWRLATRCLRHCYSSDHGHLVSRLYWRQVSVGHYCCYIRGFSAYYCGVSDLLFA